MSCRGTFDPLFLSLIVTLLAAMPGTSLAKRVLVPEEMSLASAIDMAVAGDTLSLAPGSYERTPDPFIKAIVIEARMPDDPPVLRHLSAGLVTLHRILFEPDGSGGANPVLLRLLDSAQLEHCGFRGFGSTGIEIQDDASDHDWLVVVDNCEFADLNGGVSAGFLRGGSRIVIRNTLFEESFFGIRLVMPAAGCPAIPFADPPPLGMGPARLTVTGSEFSNMAEMAIDVRNAPLALLLSECNINACPLGIRLERAGARVDRLDLRGLAGSSTGILAISSRLEMTASRVYQHLLGIAMTIDGGCERPAGIIGGEPAGFCDLASNTLALTTTSPVDADYNWWGTLICSEAQEFTQGVVLRFLANADGTEFVECLTPVVPATWSRIKARLAP